MSVSDWQYSKEQKKIWPDQVSRHKKSRFPFFAQMDFLWSDLFMCMRHAVEIFFIVVIEEGGGTFFANERFF